MSEKADRKNIRFNVTSSNTCLGGQGFFLFVKNSSLVKLSIGHTTDPHTSTLPVAAAVIVESSSSFYLGMNYYYVVPSVVYC